jgi:diacylglycerol kinase family enzyme
VRIAVVRNPGSGTALDKAELENALRNAGVNAVIFDIPRGSGFKEWIDRVVAGHDVIAAAGGDGTVSTIAAGVARGNKILAIIPSGTLNHFARDAGIPTELDQAVAIIRNGQPRAVDHGTVNDQFFLNNVSLGNYPRMVKERDALESRGRSHRVAGLIAIAQTWWRLGSLGVTITVDDQTLTRRSPFILAGNGCYSLSGFALGKRENISDGCLSLYVAPQAGRFGTLSLPMRALVGSLERYEQFETFTAKEISIASRHHRRILTAVDGELIELQSPLRLVIKPRGLKVLMP